MVRVKLLLLLLLAGMGLLAQTTVEQILLDPGGTALRGSVDIEISQPCTISTGQRIGGRVASVTLTTTGTFSKGLHPNTGASACTPANTYYRAVYNLRTADNRPSPRAAEIWTVPTSATAVTISSIVTATTPVPLPTIGPSQFAFAALGGMLYGGAAGVGTELAGNTTTAKRFLTQTGTGAVSAAPAWAAIVAGDMPTHTHAAADITSGQLATARGGSGADLSATGGANQFVKQTSAGGAFTVAAVVDADIPSTFTRDTEIILGVGSLTTVGAVPFVTSSGTLGQDASNLCWDDTNNRLGIGTCAPGVPLHISSAGNTVFRVQAGTGNFEGGFDLRSGGGGVAGDHSNFTFMQASVAKWAMAGVWNGLPDYRLMDASAGYVTRMHIHRTTKTVGFGPENTAGTGLVHIYDPTVVTGVTDVTVRAGAGQASTPLQVWQNNAGANKTIIGAAGDLDASAAPTTRITSAAGAPVAGDCDVAGEVGRIYARTDALDKAKTYYGCENTAAATFAWRILADLASNLGTGAQVFKQKTGDTFEFRTAIAGSAGGVVVTQTANTIEFVTDSAVVPQYLTGAGAPSANCTAGRDYYLNTTSGEMSFCRATNTWQVVVDGRRTLTGGAGIAALGDLTADRTIATASGETDFLAVGALTCGAATRGRMQVHTTPLQYCDNAATPALQYAAYGISTGEATAGDSATAFFAAGQIEAARGGTGDDTSATTGVPRIAAGNWTYDAGVSHLAASTSADLAGVLSNETGTGPAVFSASPTLTGTVTIDRRLEFTEAVGDPACAAGDFWISASSTGNVLRKCQNGSVADLDTGGAGGDNITVNATAATDANFSDTLPAAPSDGVNIRFQIDTAASPDNMSGNLQFATGALAGAVSAAAQTFAGAKTFIAALKVDEVALTQEDDAIGTTSTAGVILQNTTAAAAGLQQQSPALELTGQGWKTDATAASQTVKWRLENLPVEGAANPSTTLLLRSEVNAAGFTTRASLTSAGIFDATILRENGFEVPTVNNNLGVFAATTSAQLAGVLSDETGTGLVVFSASPTLTGTVSIDRRLEFTEAAGDPACAAGDFWISASSTGNVLRKCQNGSLADLDTGGAGGDNITVNATTATDANLSDTLPAAPSDGVNIRFQIDTAASPDNVSGNLQFATGALAGALSTAAQTIAGAKTFNAALKVDEATLTQEDDAIGTTSTAGTILQNTTAAAAGLQQQSPALELTGQGWKTDATAASQTVKWRFENLPVQGAANPTTTLLFRSEVNAVGFTTRASLTSAGVLDATTLTEGTVGVPNVNDNLSVFAATTSAQFAGVVSDESGTGLVILQTSPTIVTPTIAATGWTNANHAHAAANSGGTLDGAAIATGEVADARIPDILTLNVDAEGAGNTLTVPALAIYKAAVCQNATASLGFSTPTTSPAVAACVTGTNTQYGVAQFADGSNLSVQDHFLLPSDFTGNIDVTGMWRTSATTGNVVWQIATICVADAETGDPAFNAASTVTETAKATANQFNTFSMTSITITGCAASEELFFKFSRDSAHASDTLAATAELISFAIKYRRAM